MKKLFTISLAALAMAATAGDKVFLYSPGIKDGVRIAYLDETKPDGGEFVDIAQIFSSDYGTWGGEKRMFSEYAIALDEGGYAAVFQVNDVAPCFAVAYSEDLTTWRPQDYPRMSHQGVLAPVIVRNGNNSYSVVYKTRDGKYRKTNTDALFRHFSPDIETTAQEYETANQKRDLVNIGGKQFTGNIISLEGKAQTVEGVRNYFKALGEKSATWGETLNDDQKNFASLIAKGGVEASIEVKNGNAKKISDKLIGIFFEDISYAADGGLYAEMVQNRDFEYTPKDHKGWNAFTAWRLASGSKAQIVNNKP